MSVLVDYSCAKCLGPHEVWVSGPVPAQRPCPVCGTPARRRFGGALLRGATAPRPAQAAQGKPSCHDYPTVPGLCHMTPSAARGWIARARGDGRELDRELARQESAVAKAGPAVMAPPVSHDHGHGSGHHSHSHSRTDSHTDSSGAPGGQQSI